jgi:hypothetical protein
MYKSYIVDERMKNKTIFFAPPRYDSFFILCDVLLGQIVKSGFISIFCRQTYLALFVNMHIYVYCIHTRLDDFPSTPNVTERRKVFIIIFLFPRVRCKIVKNNIKQTILRLFLNNINHVYGSERTEEYFAFWYLREKHCISKNVA